MEYIQEQTRLGELANEWTALGDIGVLVGVGITAAGLLILGYIAWLKGHRLGAFLMWLVLMLGAGWLIAPTAWSEDWLNVDESTVTLWLGVAAGVSIVFGVFVTARLAKPSSWWAQRRYASEKYDRAVERFGWSRIRAR